MAGGNRFVYYIIYRASQQRSIGVQHRIRRRHRGSRETFPDVVMLCRDDDPMALRHEGVGVGWRVRELTQTTL